MAFRVVRTNQYNQDLGLIHSTNCNHLESPNEGSSIDHQVTIHLHAQNITMFPTNETWYFTSQMLVSSSGGLILIFTVQSTRNESLFNTIVNIMIIMRIKNAIKKLSSLDLSYARLCDDSVITKHHTAKLRDQLKTAADGLDIKIDVLERTLTQRMVDELAVVNSQLAAIVEGLKETGVAKKGESGQSSIPREGTSGGGPSSHGGRGRGRGRSDNPDDPSNRFRYTNWF
ncbi:hypothetical protein F511_17922 [Dorcoceras hygrometricum]|uniref:Uncharacterized protein n=1 Tax=Dorcoceras hygrometricum TaxID=472368 RepID=A0A2Z7BZA3_9LAMI|nr:hypothetical protein F511_17922 [Dorcoceras hygrometricum]